MLRSISEFCPAGMQIAYPGGLSIDPNQLVAIEAHSSRLVLHTGSDPAITISFHANVDGSAPDVYGLAHNIRTASQQR